MEKGRDSYTVAWSPERIKALRDHMGMTQQQMADELGVRQQTISEWEVGVYTPRRATQKYLTLIAERVGFTYQAAQEDE